MSNGMYEVLALLPTSSDFTLDLAIAHFRATHFGSGMLQSGLASPEGVSQPSGFRVSYGGWEVVAWLETGAEILSDCRALVDANDLPATAEMIESCSRRLAVWSDEDSDGDHSDEITHFTDELRMRFGAFIYDPVNGGWWH